MQIWKYDDNYIFIESIMYEFEYDEDGAEIPPTFKYTTVPLLVGYVKPTFNEELQEWFEGATEEEIKAWEEANKVVVEPTELEELSEYVLNIEMKALELEEQTVMNSEYVLDLDTRITNIEVNQNL